MLLLTSKLGLFIYSLYLYIIIIYLFLLNSFIDSIDLND